jgi:hypothetical protein
MVATMTGTDVKIPPPFVVRERLAENLRERRILRSLLRVSQSAAQAQASGQIKHRLIEGPLTAGAGA